MQVREQLVDFHPPSSPPPAVVAVAMPTAQRAHKWTRRQYRRLAEEGFIDAEARVELVEGQIIEMSPIGALHFGFQLHILDWMYARFDLKKYQCVGQSSLGLGEYNEPQPDAYLVPRRADSYTVAIPTEEDAILVIEVADSSIDYDLEEKCLRYARFGIPEYWVIDCLKRQLHYHEAPGEEGYRRISVLDVGEAFESKLCGRIDVAALMPAAPTPPPPQ